MNVTAIAATKVETATIATSEGGEAQAPVHALMSLVLNPGDGARTLDGTYSVMLHVQQGTIRVTAKDVDARIDAGSGDPITYGIDEAEICAGGACDLVAEQSADLGPGNQLSIKGGSLELVVDEPAEALVSLLIPDPGPGLNHRCWICPQELM